MVFRRDGWNQGVALYAPFDRVAADGHCDWAAKHPHLIWHAGRNISFYLEQVYDILNGADYVGL
jgi:hypothetical protein